MRVELPNNWTPRAHQLPLWRAMTAPAGEASRRAAVIWHRRAGKDSTCINLTAVKAHQRVGVYWHLLPTAKQGRKVVWDNIDYQGRRVIDQAFPKSIRKSTNNTEMRIELLNGSIYQVVGSDNYDSLVGSNPVGVIFSEYSVADPAAWDYLRPILAENEGFALFIYTPRGRNHGYTLHRSAKANDNWFTETLSVEDTSREDGEPIITPTMIAEERASGMSDEMIRQEYFCSFDAGLTGAFYASEMEAAWKEKRIANVPYDPDLPVSTFWDLGINDTTAIWFAQFAGSEVRFIDYLEDKDLPMGHYIREVKQKPYLYSNHIAPHDIRVREYTLGTSRWEKARELGVTFDIAPKLPLLDGIDSTRSLLRRSWFDEQKCKRGIECLENYQKRWDDRLKTYGRQPIHNWASNGADAMRYCAVSRELVSNEMYHTNWNQPLDYPSRIFI